MFKAWFSLGKHYYKLTITESVNDLRFFLFRSPIRQIPAFFSHILRVFPYFFEGNFSVNI